MAVHFSGRLDNETYYKKLVETYITACPDLKNQVQLQKAQEKWNQFKNSSEDYDKLLVSLKAVAAKRKSTQLQWWTNVSSTKSRKG